MCSQGVLARNLVGWGCFTAEQTDGETAPEEAPESVGGGGGGRLGIPLGRGAAPGSQEQWLVAGDKVFEGTGWGVAGKIPARW